MRRAMVTAPEVAREVKFCALDYKSFALDGVFEGYASLFNREDLSRDVVLPGAFRETLAGRRLQAIKMLFQHDAHQPIGVWLKLHEDAKGLYVRGKLMREVAKAREVLALMRAGAIDGLSIGFRTVKGARDRYGVRRLEKIDLWEISIVTFPMQPQARVSAVNAASNNDRTPELSEIERWLKRMARSGDGQARTAIGAHKHRFDRAGRTTTAREWEARLLGKLCEATMLLKNQSVTNRTKR